MSTAACAAARPSCSQIREVGAGRERQAGPGLPARVESERRVCELDGPVRRLSRSWYDASDVTRAAAPCGAGASHVEDDPAPGGLRRDGGVDPQQIAVEDGGVAALASAATMS